MGQISVAKILPKLRVEDNQNLMTRKKEKMKSYDKKERKQAMISYLEMADKSL